MTLKGFFRDVLLGLMGDGVGWLMVFYWCFMGVSKELHGCFKPFRTFWLFPEYCKVL